VELAKLVHRQPMSEGAEAYRTLRTAVYFGACAGRARTLLITSPGPGEGKSTTVANLAIAMAQTGRRILLMDADFRRPQQHAIFGLEGEKGLANVLRGEVTPEEVIEATEIGNLEVLPCGAIPENPAEMLSSSAFAELLAGLRARYDTVVIDSPPAGAVTDAPILSTQVDASVLVVRVGVSSRQGVSEAMDCLNGVGAKMVGVVANEVICRSRHRYYGRHGRYGGAVAIEDRGAGTRLVLGTGRLEGWRADAVGAGPQDSGQP
jgi:capsular exopolysaccharide synthesis family protein